MGQCFLYKRGSGGGGGVVGKEATAKGSVLSLANSLERPLKGLRIFGRTSQNGTPTPDAPVALVSPGDDGVLDVNIVGKNLLEVNFAKRTDRGVTFEGDGAGGVIVSGSASSYPYCAVGQVYLIANVAYSAFLRGNIPNTLKMRIVDRTVSPVYIPAQGAAANSFKAKTSGWYLYELTTDPGFDGSFTCYPQIEAAAAVTDYEPYKTAQTLPLPTPNGLPGIPVASGGNYTDTSGLQWVCDEVDFSRGVYVQRTQVYSFTGDENVSAPYWDATGFYYNIGSYGYPAPINGSELVTTPCSHTTGRGALVQGTLFFRNIGSFASQAEAKAWLKSQYNAGTSFTVLYQLATPVETPLSAEDLTAYAALHTNYPNTTIYNDGGAEMEVKYIGG